MYSELVNLNPSCSRSTKIVVGLLARCGLLDKGHKIYLDNYCSSELAEELDFRDTYLCGTVCSNRVGMPNIFSEIKLKPGESIFRREGNILVIKLHERRDVHMITCSFATNSILRGRRDDVLKPTSVVDYCKNMGGIDLSGQMLQYYEALRRTCRESCSFTC